MASFASETASRLGYSLQRAFQSTFASYTATQPVALARDDEDGGDDPIELLPRGIHDFGYHHGYNRSSGDNDSPTSPLLWTWHNSRLAQSGDNMKFGYVSPLAFKRNARCWLL